MMISRLCTRYYFAAQTVKSVPGHKPPSLADNPAGRYAGALFTSASKRECLDTVLQDVRHLHQVLNSQAQLKQFLKNSAIKRKDQKQVFSSVAKNYTQITNNFIDTVIQAGRLPDIQKMIEIYISYCKILNKEQDIKIISAKKLSTAEKEQVVVAIKKNKPDVKFKLSYEVDPAILGGLQIFAGSEFLDCSLRSRIERLKNQFARIV